MILSSKAFRALPGREMAANMLELQRTFTFVLYQALWPCGYIRSSPRLLCLRSKTISRNRVRLWSPSNPQHFFFPHRKVFINTQKNPTKKPPQAPECNHSTSLSCAHPSTSSCHIFFCKCNCISSGLNTSWKFALNYYSPFVFQSYFFSTFLSLALN